MTNLFTTSPTEIPNKLPVAAKSKHITIDGKITEVMPGDKNIVTIDGKMIEVIPGDKNIVDLADRSKIGIPAPCYRNGGGKGCCKSCVVEIDGEQQFACSTAPKDGMNIIVNRPDLKALRKKKLLAYKEREATNSSCGCSSDDTSCGTSSSDVSACCD